MPKLNNAPGSPLNIFAFVMTIGFSLFSPTTSWPADGKLMVSTTGGQLRGIERVSGGAEFLGIPYAEPPVGELRWHEPLPVKPWAGVREANAFGAPCAQPILGDWNKNDSLASQEDCLFLNVMTPTWPPKNPLPVMFWLHGGANVGGTASSALYKDGTLLQHGVVLVTVNYRLGVFGFLAHPALTRESPHHASGNYGLMDQIAALHWVHDNIAKFGGDPANITVFGQSAGAHDTSLLMTSPLSKDLFQRAIAESGSAISPPLSSLAEAEQSGQKLAAMLKAPAGIGTLNFLRHLSTEDILKSSSNGAAGSPPRVGTNIDGWVILHSPAGIFASGQESSIPLIVGTTVREFGSSDSPDELRKGIRNTSGPLADQVMALYGLANGGRGNPDPTYGSVGDQLVGDTFFRCPASTQAAWHEAAHHPTYEYEFGHAIPGQEAQGAVHSSDLPYVFGFYPQTGNISGRFGETDYKIADEIESYWTNFAKNGNPNGGTLPDWPEFDGTQAFLEFAQDGSLVATLHGLRAAQCNTYREGLKQLMNDATKPR